MASLDEIADLKAQIASLARDNAQLRVAQGVPVAVAPPESSGSGRRERRPKKDSAEKSGGGERRGGGGSGSGGKASRPPKLGGEGAAPLAEYDGRMVWVNGDSSPQTVSRSITGAAMPSARNGFPVYVFAKYDKNSNVAVKGVVSAQRVLKEKYGLSVGVYPSFRGNRNELTIKVVPLAPGTLPPHVADPSALLAAHQLSVAAATDPKVLAGAVAGQARAGSLLAVRAIGAKAVFEMLRAVGVARDYLADDGHDQDLVCYPDFVEVQLDGRAEPTNALRLIVTMTPGSPVLLYPEADAGAV